MCILFIKYRQCVCIPPLHRSACLVFDHLINMKPSLCRACLQPEADGDNSFTNLFTSCSNTDSLDHLTLCDMMLNCSNTMIQQDDGLPMCICSGCTSTLIIAYQFRITCQNSYKWLLENNFEQVKDEEDFGYDNYKCDKIEIEGSFSPKKQERIVNNHNVEIKIEEKDMLEANSEELDSNFYDNYKTPKQTIEALENNILGDTQMKWIRKNFQSVTTTSEKPKKSLLPKPLQCRQCPRMFRFPYLLRKHTKTHTLSGMKSYFCPICEKCYKSEIDHNKTHKNKAKFMCDICSKCFDTKQKVQTHLNTHLADRPKTFLCEVPGCCKAYISVQGLNRHRILHSGAKNFLCHLCSKAFTDKAGLLLHMPFHFNERNFKCRYCGKEFFTPSNRNQHEERHSERRFPCGQCEKRFYSRVALNRHMLTHTNQLEHQCAFCAKKFARLDNKKRHELVIHGYSGTRGKNLIIGRTSTKDKPP